MKDEILFKMLTDQHLFDTFVKSVGIHELVSVKQKEILSTAMDHEKMYGRVLTEAEAALLLPVAEKAQDVGSDFVFDNVLKEVKAEKLSHWVLKVAESIEEKKVDYERVYSELSSLKDRLEVHLPKGIQIGTMFDETLMLADAKSGSDLLRTHIRALDRALRGGIHKGELMFLIAPPGRGKSTFLVNLQHSFLVQGKTTLLLSNELRADVILSRLYRRILKMERSEYTMENKENVIKGLQHFFRYVHGKGAIHYVPVEEWGVSDIRSWKAAWEKAYGQQVDAIIIDYFDRLKKPWGGDNRTKLRDLTNQLRDFAVDEDILIASATQANRASLSAQLVTEEHCSEAFGKVESADVVLSLSQIDQERQEDRARLTVLKNREYGGVGTTIDIRTAFNRLLITDIEEDEGDDGI